MLSRYLAKVISLMRIKHCGKREKKDTIGRLMLGEEDDFEDPGN
jgi:hypothetical protein